MEWFVNLRELPDSSGLDADPVSADDIVEFLGHWSKAKSAKRNGSVTLEEASVTIGCFLKPESSDVISSQDFEGYKK